LNWTTVSSLATAGGTLVLAVATFAAVRSGRRSQRLAERAFQFGLRPVLAPSRLEDPEQRIMFVDRHWVSFAGGRAAVESVNGVAYLAMGVRNFGNGIAVIEAWNPYPGLQSSTDEFGDPEQFRRQTRALWIPPGDVAFWQGALRDEQEETHARITDAIAKGEVGLELLYRDHDGGQQTISRFALVRDDDTECWWVELSLHKSLDT
jgi:hypothetical protein